jgi:hypothetical protein
MTFNEAVITKCGIFIGYLYEPGSEMVYKIGSNDIHQVPTRDAFNSSDSYFRQYILLVIIFLLLPLSIVVTVRTLFTSMEQSRH